MPSTDTGDTGVATDTGPRPQPACTAYPAGACVHLTGDQPLDYAGRWIDVGDMDGDGVDEVMISESASWTITYSTTVDAAVHVLWSPAGSGTLASASQVRIDGPIANTFPYWGDPSGYVSGGSQVALGDTSVADYYLKLFDVSRSGGVQVPGEEAGRIHVPPPYNRFGFPSFVGDCQTIDGPALCVSSVDTNLEAMGDDAGQVFVFDAPVVGDVFILDARARYMGDPGDSARVVHGDADLDADGVRDIVVGAFGRGGAGVVALLVAAPDGEHGLWDVADATVTGVIPGGELGLGLSTGDLDGDGAVDVLAGAPIGATAAVCVARGPFAGDRSAAAAEWSVASVDGDWLGYDLAVGDFDGDGGPDLAVGAPRSVYSGTEPGEVLLFLAPPPGAYTPADASVVLTSGVAVADAFGMSLDVGDLDGDGRSDLVVGAPRDPTAGEYGGAAIVLYGAGL